MSSTPYLKFISPSATVAGRDVNWYGMYRISNTIDIKKMTFYNKNVGEYNCNRFFIGDITVPLNLNDNTAINDSSYVMVPCTVSEE